MGGQHGLAGAAEESVETGCGHRPGECGQPTKHTGALAGICAGGSHDLTGSWLSCKKCWGGQGDEAQGDEAQGDEARGMRPRGMRPRGMRRGYSSSRENWPFWAMS